MNAEVMKAETQSRWSHNEPNAFKTVFFALDHRAARKKGRYKTCMQTLWTMEGRIRRTRPSRSTFAEKTEKDSIDPPIHTGYFHTGETKHLKLHRATSSLPLSCAQESLASTSCHLTSRQRLAQDRNKKTSWTRASEIG